MRASRFVAVVLAFWLPVAAGCGDTTGPSTGAIRVSLATTGGDIDPDGYGVSVDGSPKGNVGANGAITIPGVLSGSHRVRLEGLAANCSADQGTERTVAVAAGKEAAVAFVVSCVARAGSIVVTTRTTGADLDSDGYVVTVDSGFVSGSYVQTIGANGTAIFAGLREGAHAVTLSGIAANCTAGGRDRLSVSVAAGEAASASFAVTCVASVGGVRVTTVTTGAELDPDGYTADVWTPDYYYPVLVGRQRIGVNASATFPSIPAGAYAVGLSGISPNCSVGGPGAVPVTVTTGVTAEVEFHVSCAATGTLRITNVTSGPDPDPDGYALLIAGATSSAGNRLPTNGSVTIPGLVVGTYRLTLTEVAENCAVGGGTERQIEITAGTTVVALDATCVVATRLAFVSGNDIFVGKSNGAEVVRLTSIGRNADPAWSPDGRRIAFASDRGGGWDIYVMDADGSGVARRTTTGMQNRQPAWSPDGRRIAFTSARDGNAEIYVMSAADDGTNPVRLTSHGAPDAAPAWSPDGSTIAFASTRDGTINVYVMNADGTGLTRLTNGTGGLGFGQPAWSPDGRRIAVDVSECFYYYYGCSIQVGVMNARGGIVTSLAPAQDPVRPTWSPDGRTIAFTGVHCGRVCVTAVTYVRADGSSGGRAELIAPNSHSPAWQP